MSHRRLKKILVDAGLDQATTAADVDTLHAGRVLVLVHSDSALDDIAAVIDDLDQGHDFQQTLPLLPDQPTESSHPPARADSHAGFLAPYREALVIALARQPTS